MNKPPCIVPNNVQQSQLLDLALLSHYFSNYGSCMMRVCSLLESLHLLNHWRKSQQLPSIFNTPAVEQQRSPMAIKFPIKHLILNTSVSGLGLNGYMGLITTGCSELIFPATVSRLSRIVLYLIPEKTMSLLHSGRLEFNVNFREGAFRVLVSSGCRMFANTEVQTQWRVVWYALIVLPPP